MFVLTEDAVVVCKHQMGVVKVVPTQSLVTIRKRRVLIDDNPESRPVSGCPNMGPTIKPCTTTLKVQKGYSDLLRINGKKVCLDSVTGLTDGTPPGTIKYVVRDPGQKLVSSKR